MKNKLLFIASAYLDFSKQTGVTKKILNQERILKKEYDVLLVAFKRNGIVIKNFNGEISEFDSKNKRRLRNLFVKKIIDQYNFTNVFIRNGAMDFYYIKLLKILKRKELFNIVEIPTFPYDGELKHSLKARAILLIDKLCRHSVRKYVDYFATYSLDTKIYGVKCINIRNGIDVFSNSIVNNNVGKDEFSMIAVANVSFWHGYDRMLNAIKKYNGNHKIKFNIVGDGPAINDLKKLSNDLELNDKVIFYGFKSGSELINLYEKANIGVASLGLHRLGLSHADALKVREYASLGFPIICCDNVNVESKDWNYSIIVPSGEDDYDLENVIKEFKQIIVEEDYRLKIREYAENNFDISITFLPILNKFKEHISGGN